MKERGAPVPLPNKPCWKFERRLVYPEVHMPAWKTHSRRAVFDQPPWLKVEHHSVELPDGRIIPDWAWVVTPDYINVVVETESSQFLCFRQLKYAVAAPMLA